MAHPVTHFEINARDAKAQQKFYRDVFGWKIDANNPQNYGIAMAQDGKRGINGGIGPSQDGRSWVTFYVECADIAGSLAKIEEQAVAFRHLVALGGDHTITLALLRALARREGPLGLLHFDGHVDTWPESFGLVFGHGSPFYHAIEEGLIDPGRTIQIGIRSPLHRDIFDWTVGKGVTIVSAEEVHETSPQAVAERIRAVVGTEPAYLSFDVDALDPAFAPGTGTPEVGGLATWQARAILRRIAGLNFAGMDVVEVSPPYDVAEITALAAATMAWDYIALLAPHATR